MVTPFRERDVRVLIRDLLDYTGAFDRVSLSGLPEQRGLPADGRCLAVIEPLDTIRDDPWDDLASDPLMTCRLRITLLARDEDPQLRDDTAEWLLNIAANALMSDALFSWAIPARTRIQSWAWEDTIAPERRISAVFAYQYLVDGISGMNTME